MRRPQLEHIIHAAAGITGATEFVVVGSQAVLGQFPEALDDLLVSVEADVFSLRDPADSDLIDGSIGEGSPFHQTFGYYAHGVSVDTAVLPGGWRERLIAIHNPDTGGGKGLRLEIHDLAVSKLIAGREKDAAFLTGLSSRTKPTRRTGFTLRTTGCTLRICCGKRMALRLQGSNCCKRRRNATSRAISSRRVGT